MRGVDTVRKMYQLYEAFLKVTELIYRFLRWSFLDFEGRLTQIARKRLLPPQQLIPSELSTFSTYENIELYWILLGAIGFRFGWGLLGYIATSLAHLIDPPLT